MHLLPHIDSTIVAYTLDNQLSHSIDKILSTDIFFIRTVQCAPILAAIVPATRFRICVKPLHNRSKKYLLLKGGYADV